MKKLIIASLFLLLASASEAQTNYAYQAINRNIILASQVCGGAARCNLVGNGSAFHRLTWTVLGTLSACSVRVDSSADGVVWNVGDIIAAQTCTSNGTTISTSNVVNYVRVNIVTITPVSTATLTTNLTGYINNPAGTGGTVTSIATTAPLSGGTITTTGTISCPTCGTGTGSVNSVAMTGDDTVFNASVTGSPITTTGTLAPSLHTQTANTVLAGPTSGGAVAPTFRALVAGDIPAGAGLPTGLITSDTVRYNEYGDAAWDKVAAIPAFVRLNADPGNAIMVTIGSGIAATNVGTPTILPATATESPMLHLAAAATQSTSIVLGNTWGFTAGVSRITRGVIRRYSCRVRLNGTTNVRYWIGLSDSLGGAQLSTGWATDTPAGTYIAFRFSSGTDSTIKAVTGTSNVLQTVQDTTVSVDTTNTQLLEIAFDSTNAYFYINGVLKNTISTNLAATSVLLNMNVVGDNKNTNNAQTLDLESQQIIYK